MNEMGLSGLATETGREAVGKYEYENDRLTKFTFHETYSGSGYEEDSVYSYAYGTNKEPKTGNIRAKHLICVTAAAKLSA